MDGPGSRALPKTEEEWERRGSYFDTWVINLGQRSDRDGDAVIKSHNSNCHL